MAVTILILLFTLYAEKGNYDEGNVGVSKELLREVVSAEINQILLGRASKERISTSPSGKVYPEVTRLSTSQRLRILVTGGAGFVGSHLVDRLMMQVCGSSVLVQDLSSFSNYSTHFRAIKSQ